MLARITTNSARRLPRVSPVTVRHYADSFNKKEKAHEDQYARSQETDQLKKLKDEVERKKAELAKLEKEHQEALSKQK